MGSIDVFDLLWGQIVNVPLINPLSYVYVILNLVAWVLPAVADFLASFLSEQEG